MFLSKLSVHGFKSFAKPVELDFAPTRLKQRLVAVVGPNGSGKSNIADAVRWVLGEQSLKLLRGKKSEDVIFSGSDMRGRSGFAEVALTLNNEDRSVDIDFTEVTVSRRISRDGTSEYSINGTPSKLSDIQLLLSKAHLGQSSYAVIGQGMVDSVLSATPTERKEFFDEATGVKHLEMKKEQSRQRLNQTKENLAQAQALLAEIEPRLKSLARQVKRLNEREAIAAEYRTLALTTYGWQLKKIDMSVRAEHAQVADLEHHIRTEELKLEEVRTKLKTLEVERSRSERFLDLQAHYQKLIEERQELKEDAFALKRELENFQRANRREIPSLGELVIKLEELLHELSATSTDASILTKILTKLKDKIRSIVSELKGEQQYPSNPQIEGQLHTIDMRLATIEGDIAKAQDGLEDFRKEEAAQKGVFFELQHSFQQHQEALMTLRGSLSEIKITEARLSAHREDLIRSLTEHELTVDAVLATPLGDNEPNIEADMTELRKLAKQLELIGTLDEETIREYQETKSRYDTLHAQTSDLEAAMQHLDAVIEELEETIKREFNQKFSLLEREFTKYFRMLFGGGRAELKLIKSDIQQQNDDAEQHEATEPLTRLGRPKDEKVITGVDVQATPPGKKLSSVNSLSGGERALTSIALISAIIATQPAPFVILDEVDAALDEANSERFAAIIDELSTKTQFIAITHNRATMHQAGILYGVTMSDDGVSAVLSLKLEQAAELVPQAEVAS